MVEKNFCVFIVYIRATYKKIFSFNIYLNFCPMEAPHFIKEDLLSSSSSLTLPIKYKGGWTKIIIRI